MLKILNFAIPILFLALSACTQSSQIELGKSTESQLQSSMGPEASKATNGTSTTYFYESQESYQVDQGIVRGHYRKPQKQETSLNYWLNIWAGHNKVYSKRGEEPVAELEITEASTGNSIVFDPRVQQVIRVMEYKK